MKSNLPVSVKWPHHLPLEYAEHLMSQPTPIYTLEELQVKYDLGDAQFHEILNNEIFLKEVESCKSQIGDISSLVKKKAEIQTQFYLDNWVPQVMADREAPLAEKNKLFQFVVKLSGMDNSEKANPTLSTPSQNIVLNFTNVKPEEVSVERVKDDE